MIALVLTVVVALLGAGLVVRRTGARGIEAAALSVGLGAAQQVVVVVAADLFADLSAPSLVVGTVAVAVLELVLTRPRGDAGPALAILPAAKASTWSRLLVAAAVLAAGAALVALGLRVHGPPADRPGLRSAVAAASNAAEAGHLPARPVLAPQAAHSGVDLLAWPAALAGDGAALVLAGVVFAGAGLAAGVLTHQARFRVGASAVAGAAVAVGAAGAASVGATGASLGSAVAAGTFLALAVERARAVRPRWHPRRIGPRARPEPGSFRHLVRAPERTASAVVVVLVGAVALRATGTAVVAAPLVALAWRQATRLGARRGARTARPPAVRSVGSLVPSPS